MLDAVITLVIDREHAQTANARHGAQTPPGGLCIRCGLTAGATARGSVTELGAAAGKPAKRRDAVWEDGGGAKRTRRQRQTMSRVMRVRRSVGQPSRADPRRIVARS